MDATTLYYQERHRGAAFTPDQGLRTTVDALLTFLMTLWHQRNAAYHGVNDILTLERKRKATALKAAEVY